MSGIEIAGIVLGAFPIAIEALKQYRNVARTFGFWWEIRAEYEKCSGDLKYQQLSFTRNLKLLLLPLIAEDAYIKSLLSDPGGAEWKQPEIARRLEDRLQDSYELYFNIVQAMQGTMKEFHEELAVDRASVQEKLNRSKSLTTSTKLKPRRNPFIQSTAEYEFYRIKFSLGEAPRKRLLDQLQTFNDRLEKLLSTGDAVTKLEGKRKAMQCADAKSAMNAAFGYFWKHADRLYQALANSWNCKCASQHCAKLILRHRTTADLEFLLLLCFSHKPSHLQSSSWSLFETKIEISEQPEPTFQLPSAPSTRLPKVTFSLIPPPAIASPDGQSTQDPQLQPINSLCQSFSNLQSSTSSCGFLEDDFKRYYVFPRPGDVALDPDTPIHLDQLLRQDFQPSLSRRQRYSIALILSSSFLQLRDSQWLQSTLKRTEITFFREKTNPEVILLDRPHISRDFDTSKSHHKSADDLSSFASLGIILLELCFGKPIETCKYRLKYPPGDEQTKESFDLLAAVEWLKEVGEEAGPDYASAVDWCLLGSRKLLNGTTWRRNLYQEVVQPLERCHGYLHSGMQELL